MVSENKRIASAGRTVEPNLRFRTEVTVSVMEATRATTIEGLMATTMVVEVVGPSLVMVETPDMKKRVKKRVFTVMR